MSNNGFAFSSGIPTMKDTFPNGENEINDQIKYLGTKIC